MITLLLADPQEMVAESLRLALDGAPDLTVTGVATSFDELERLAVGRPADVILLDNMPPATLAAAVRRVGGRALSEASGGLSLQTIRACAESGVDLISVGALTHSARALDLGLDFD